MEPLSLVLHQVGIGAARRRHWWWPWRRCAPQGGRRVVIRRTCPDSGEPMRNGDAPALAGLLDRGGVRRRPDIDEGLVARAGDHELTVDQAVKLLVDQENLPNQTDVVQALADLWVDYTLLAREVARDSTLKDVDLEPLVRQQLEQQMIAQLRDSVIQVDTAISETDLREAYETQAPGARIHASHILLGYPDQATQAQRDSVRPGTEAIRQRRWPERASRRWPASTARTRGAPPGRRPRARSGGATWCRPFEDAAFALEPGEISDIVEIALRPAHHPAGVEGRARASTRCATSSGSGWSEQRYLSAESAYVAKVGGGRAPRGRPTTRPASPRRSPRIPGRSSPAAPRIARWSPTRAARSRSGSTSSSSSRSSRSSGRRSPERPPTSRSRTSSTGMVQRELLVDEAREGGPGAGPAARGLPGGRGPPPAPAVAARRSGCCDLDRAPGEALAPAVGRAVDRRSRTSSPERRTWCRSARSPSSSGSRAPTGRLRRGVGQVLLRVGQERVRPRAPPPTGAGRRTRQRRRPDTPRRRRRNPAYERTV